MSYIITKSDGTILTELVDGTTDQVHSSLTLVAKSASAYGTALNQNFVYLLENFANSVQPRTPIVGQLWFDTTQNRLKVYDGVNFKVSGGTIVSASSPSGINAGDIWIDSNNGQLRFNDGTATVLAGPVFTRSQGLSGFVVESIIGTDGLTHIVTNMFVGTTLLGIWSNTQFTPSSPISQYTGQIYVGFNASTFTGVKLRVPVTQADTLLAADGSIKTAENFISTSDDSATAGTLTINNIKPLVLGASGNTEINVSSTLFNIQSNTSGQNFKITTRNGSTYPTALFVDATNNYIGLFNSAPTATLHVGTVSSPGSLIVEGNLTVNGTTTTINSTTINIDDKNFELAKVTTNIGTGSITSVSGPFNLGSVAVTKSGTSVTAAATYAGKTQLSTSGSGTGAVFTIVKSGAATNYSTATITVTSAGSNYAVGDTIVISGADLGGTAPTNNLTLTVVSSALGSPWIATIASISSTSAANVGSFITATSGTGVLYGGTPTSVLVTTVVSGTSIKYTVTGGTTPVIGTLTDITIGASDIYADGGGFTLKGTTDKTFIWTNAGAYWSSSEHINLVSGRAYKINGTTVLDTNTLGAGITNSSLTSVGTLTSLNVTNLSITADLSGNVTLANSTPAFTDGNIVLDPKGAGIISASSSKISNVADPASAQDAATKNYVDTQVKTRSVAISLTTTGLTNAQIAITYLAKLFPNTEWLDSSICRAVCTDGAGTAIRKFTMQSGVWAYQNDL